MIIDANNNTKRIGIFEIPDSMMNDALKTDNLTSKNIIQTIMSNVVIIRAEHMFDMMKTEYIAYSESFEPVDMNTKAPRYRMCVTHNKDDIYVMRAERVQS